MLRNALPHKKHSHESDLRQLRGQELGGLENQSNKETDHKKIDFSQKL